MIIIKIGGGNDINLKSVVYDLKHITEDYIIVHGANALRDEIAEKLGRPKTVVTSVSGYSSVLSDQESLDIMMMAYSGLRNKRLVELCHQAGINAIGLTGIDGKIVVGKRNTGIRVREKSKLKMVRDFSGKPKAINTELLNLLIQNGYVPVLTVPIIDENNFAISSENDDIVAILKESMNVEKIVQLIEAPGFLNDPNDPESLIKSIKQQDLEKWEQMVEGRMKRKILALRKLFKDGKGIVYISDGRTHNPVIDALNGKGTIIK